MRYAPNALDLIGQRFGRLTVIEKLGRRPYGGQSVMFWQCRCECGKEIEVSTGNLRSCNTVSCGCGKIGARRAVKHGNFKHPLYQIWADMLRRCGDPMRKDWSRYGARGIRVCDRWLTDFRAFVSDMGPRPPGTTLDRRDNDGPYSPENCRWASPVLQASNNRRTRWVTAFGQTKTMQQWADECGVRSALLGQRIDRDGLTPEEAIRKSQKGGVAY